MRQRLNLTIHPEIREFAEQMATKRRRSIFQIFEELIEAEWNRQRMDAKECSGNPAKPKRRTKPGTPSPK